MIDLSVSIVSVRGFALPSIAQEKPLLGLVSIAATEANNVRYINGAKKAAEELGWEVSVVDAAGSADQARMAAMMPSSSLNPVPKGPTVYEA